MVRLACCLCLGSLVLSCALSMFVLSQTSLSHSGAFGCYAQFDIWKREMNSRVEWIRVYTPGTWQPVAESTLGPAPDHASTYREWRRVYHFDVYWPRDSTGGTIADALALPVSYVSFYTWQYRDWHPSIGSPDLMYAGLSSSSASSVSDGGWHSPSPPAGYDPNFD